MARVEGCCGDAHRLADQPSKVGTGEREEGMVPALLVLVLLLLLVGDEEEHGTAGCRAARHGTAHARRERLGRRPRQL